MRRSPRMALALWSLSQVETSGTAGGCRRRCRRYAPLRPRQSGFFLALLHGCIRAGFHDGQNRGAERLGNEESVLGAAVLDAVVQQGGRRLGLVAPMIPAPAM